VLLIRSFLRKQGMLEKSPASPEAKIQIDYSSP
jgi:hypothetical protein